MICAQWGWACAGKDLLECKLCKVKLHFVCAVPTWQFDQYKEVEIARILGYLSLTVCLHCHYNDFNYG